MPCTCEGARFDKRGHYRQARFVGGDWAVLMPVDDGRTLAGVAEKAAPGPMMVKPERRDLRQLGLPVCFTSNVVQPGLGRGSELECKSARRRTRGDKREIPICTLAVVH